MIKIEYSGEYTGRIYMACDYREATFTPDPTEVTSAKWAYCRDFVAARLKRAIFKVSTDVIYEFTGEMFFIWYNLMIASNYRPTLMRMLKETVKTLTWVDGASSANGNIASFKAEFPYTPPQSFSETHPAMTTYMPLNLFTLSNPESAYPECSAYSLERIFEYEFNSMENCVNLFVTTTTNTAGGFIAPMFSGGSNAGSWAITPDITETRLIVEHYIVHIDLQNMIAVNPHAFLIRQYITDVEILDGKTIRDYPLTKAIETFYFICRHAYNVTHTDHPTDTITYDTSLTVVPAQYKIDPFYLPENEVPIDHISLTARGNEFYRDLRWSQLSEVHPTLFATPYNSLTKRNSVALITFALYYYRLYQTGSYNSGVGPNCRLAWTTNLFTTTDQGQLITCFQVLNMVLVYKGRMMIRFS